MTIDGKILARARKRLKNIRLENERALGLRRAEAYEKNPNIARIEKELRRTMLEVVSSALSGGGDIEDIRDRNLSLQSALIYELTVSGFPPDYLDEKPNCPKCGDTGYVSGEMCSCLKELYAEEQVLELSSLMKLPEDTFDSFDLDCYDDIPDPVTGISPRENMEIVKYTCWTYANKFGPHSSSLYLTGAPGLGKTFLSACIAKVVSERGFSVVYDTAVSVFQNFEEEKFAKFDDISEARGQINRYLSCDLLILDDLGTELTTAFTVTALYTIVNTRLVSGKKTIISSNLPAEEIYSRYSPQIASRIMGEYTVLKFMGSDIRLKRGI